MTPELVAAFLALAGTLVTVVVTAIATSTKIRRDLESQYDVSLRGDRIAVYHELWALLQPLAKYARPAPTTYARLERLAEQLRAWYFESGGLYLTEPSRDAYFALQEELRSVLLRAQPDGARVVDEKRFTRLRELGSTLRTAMAEDVQTRRASLLGRR